MSEPAGDSSWRSGPYIAGPYSPCLLARIYLLAREPEKAVAPLEALRQVPDYFSPAWIRTDPTLAGLLRGRPPSP